MLLDSMWLCNKTLSIVTYLLFSDTVLQKYYFFFFNSKWLGKNSLFSDHVRMRCLYVCDRADQPAHIRKDQKTS